MIFLYRFTALTGIPTVILYIESAPLPYLAMFMLFNVVLRNIVGCWHFRALRQVKFDVSVDGIGDSGILVHLPD